MRSWCQSRAESRAVAGRGQELLGVEGVGRVAGHPGVEADVVAPVGQAPAHPLDRPHRPVLGGVLEDQGHQAVLEAAGDVRVAQGGDQHPGHVLVDAGGGVLTAQAGDRFEQGQGERSQAATGGRHPLVEGHGEEGGVEQPGGLVGDGAASAARRSPSSRCSAPAQGGGLEVGRPGRHGVALHPCPLRLGGRLLGLRLAPTEPIGQAEGEQPGEEGRHSRGTGEPHLLGHHGRHRQDQPDAARDHARGSTMCHVGQIGRSAVLLSPRHAIVSRRGARWPPSRGPRRARRSGRCRGARPR